MGGRNTLAYGFLPFPSLLVLSLSYLLTFLLSPHSIYNTCQDSLLATPLILDLAILAELMTRVTYRDQSAKSPEFEKLYSVLGLLSYMLKVRLPSFLPLLSLREAELTFPLRRTRLAGSPHQARTSCR